MNSVSSSHYHNTFRAFQTVPSPLVLSSSTTIKSLCSETDETENEGQEHVLLSSLDEFIYGTAFIQRLYDLQEFKETYGHCRVPKRYAKNKTLGNFVNKSRQMYRKYNIGEKSSMTPERINVLNQMGFEWGCEKIIKSRVYDSSGMSLAWKEKLNELKTHNELYGGGKIPSSSPLGNWCIRQRREYLDMKEGVKSSMTEEKVAALKSVNFDFSPSETKWNLRIKQLMDYKEIFGDCMVPVQYKANPQLGRWVNTQRKYYKLYQEGLPSRITAKRIKQLNELDFAWSRWDKIWSDDGSL